MAGNLKVTIGADPELFLRDKTSGKIVSAHNLLPGTKLEPYPVKYGAVQVDGVAAEFNIDPTLNHEDFCNRISQVKASILGFVGNGIELVEEPVAMFDQGYFHGLPEAVRELGCNPDFNAWTGQVNTKPNGDTPINGEFMRTAAGHIHIGWGKGFDINDQTHIEDCRIIVKQLDYYLGIYSLMWDNDNRRRSMYGKAGAFRPKPYGVEYRPLSNVWLRSAALQSWIWKTTNKAVLDVIQSGHILEEKFGDAAQKIIDSNVVWWEDKEFKKIHQETGLNSPPKIKTKEQIEVEEKEKEKARREYFEAMEQINLAHKTKIKPPSPSKSKIAGTKAQWMYVDPNVALNNVLAQTEPQTEVTNS